MKPSFHVRVERARLTPRHSLASPVTAVAGLSLVLTLSSTVQLGCTSNAERGGEPLKPGPAAVNTIGGIEYRGDLAVMESFPVQLGASVVVTNTSGRSQRLEFPDGCIVLMRAYRGDKRVWDQASSAVCTMAIEVVPLRPGQSTTFRSSTNAYDVLGGNLPDGRYRMTAYLRPGGKVVEVELGSADLAIPRG